MSRSAQTQRELEPVYSIAVSGGSAQTRRERPNSVGASKLCNSNDASMTDPHCEGMLYERTNHTRVESIGFFVADWICRVGMVI